MHGTMFTISWQPAIENNVQAVSLFFSDYQLRNKINFAVLHKTIPLTNFTQTF